MKQKPSLAKQTDIALSKSNDTYSISSCAMAVSRKKTNGLHGSILLCFRTGPA